MDPSLPPKVAVPDFFMPVHSMLTAEEALARKTAWSCHYKTQTDTVLHRLMTLMVHWSNDVFVYDAEIKSGRFKVVYEKFYMYANLGHGVNRISSLTDTDREVFQTWLRQYGWKLVDVLHEEKYQSSLSPYEGGYYEDVETGFVLTRVE